MVANKRFLNVGCGNRFLKDWTNVDFVKTAKEVIPCNVLDGLPFPDSSFDVVYHSHVLEHFSKSSGIFLMQECFRVLSPGGIVRVVVPDLEEIVRQYLKNLSRALAGEADYDYEWIILELMDQMVRSKSGGDMADYWRQSSIPNEAYVESRLGKEFTSFRERLKSFGKPGVGLPKKVSFRDRLIRLISRDKSILEFAEVGRFRLGGEVHQWMYDRYSLNKLLVSTGFKSVRQVDAFTSGISNWGQYRSLDVEQEQIRKPDSLFMEGVK